MLHLEIQKGKETMKTLKFQNVLGGTTDCMKRLAIVTKGCGQLTSNNTYFADRWFSSVKTDEEMAPAGVNYCGLVKVGDNVTPRYLKGEGGYEDIIISKCSGRYYCVHEGNSYCY